MSFEMEYIIIGCGIDWFYMVSLLKVMSSVNNFQNLKKLRTAISKCNHKVCASIGI